jgi:hypothetical protein
MSDYFNRWNITFGKISQWIKLARISNWLHILQIEMFYGKEISDWYTITEINMDETSK